MIVQENPANRQWQRACSAYLDLAYFGLFQLISSHTILLNLPDDHYSIYWPNTINNR
jgi:hypothetical protein